MLYPTGRYNLNFDIGALLLDAILLIFYFMRPRIYHERRTRLFLLLVVMVELSAANELYTSVCRNLLNDGTPFHAEFLGIATFFSHFAHNSLPYIMFMYLHEVTGLSRRTSMRTYALLTVPQAIMTFFLVIPPLRHMIYYYSDDGVYCHGIIYTQLYVAVYVFYSLIGLYMLVSYRRALLLREYISILIVQFGFDLAMVPMVINQYLKITIFLQSLCVLIICIMLESDGEQFESETGLRRRYALWKDIRQCFEAKSRAYIISIKIHNFDYYSMILGTFTTKRLQRKIGAWLQQLSSDSVHTYHTLEGTYAVLFFRDEEEQARAAAEKIMRRFNEEWDCGGTPVFLTTQVWISAIPDNLVNEEQMNVFIDSPYDESLPENALHFQDSMKSQQRVKDVELALQHALKKDSLQVYYQPIFDTRDGRIHSCEALVRLNDEKLGFIPPEEFIRVAEQTGLINRVGRIVFEKVVSFLAVEKPEQYGLDFVEVNLSPIQCMDPRLSEQLTDILNRYHVPASRISLEITESAVIHDETAMRAVMEKLSAAGFSFALDDFGTGNANYSYVMNYPFRLIKIDKSFLWGAEKDSNTRVILSNMLNLVKHLQRDAVVEGVETEEQRDVLIARNVSYLQGYYYSKPVPAESFIRYLKDFRKNNN